MVYKSVNFKASDSVDISDRGLAFGDGIFTTAKVVDGEIEHIDDHMHRLRSGVFKLGLAPPDFNQIKAEMLKAAAGQLLATLKVIISAGNSKRGYSREGIEQPNVIVTCSAFPKHYLGWHSSGLTLGVSKTELGRNPNLAGIKHLNRLEQVMIRQELDQLPVDEVVVCDYEHCIVECNSANIFWRKNNIWYTPNLSMAGVNGIIRQKLMTLLPNVVECHARISELDSADTILLCNCLMAIAPVKNYNGRTLHIDHEFIDSLQQQLKDFDKCGE